MVEVTSLEQYFRTIWHDTPGVVHLAAKGKEEGDWHATLFTWPQDERKIIEYTQRRTTLHEVFVNPVLYKDNGVRDKTVLLKENVLGSWVAWADFDGTAPADWPVDGEIPAPSMRLITSRESHQHCYWEFNELLTDVDSLESKNRTIAYKMGADKGGWDFSQLLRPPDTTNHGYGKDRKGKTFPVIIEETSGRVFQLDALSESDEYRPIVSLFPSQEVIPAVTKVLSEHKFPKKFQDLFNYEKTPTNRSNALTSLAYLAAESGLTDLEIYSVINHADSIWGKYVGRRDHDLRLVRIIDLVRRTVPFGLPDVQFNSLFGDIEVAPKSGFSFKEFMDADVQFNWQYEGLVPESGYLLFYGSPGVGKTLLGMDFTNACITGSNWLMWKNVAGPMKVLFLSLEMNHALLREQYQKMALNMDESQINAMDERLKIYPLAETLPLDREEGRTYLNQILSESDFKPDIILIDSLSELSEKSLQDDEPARNLNRYLRHIRNRFNTSIVIIHHNKKSGANNTHTDLDAMWGSRFLGAGADSIVFFQDTEPISDHVQCTHDKSRMSKRTEPFIIHRDWYTFTFTYDGTIADDNMDERRAGEVGSALRGIINRKPSREAIGAGSGRPDGSD